VSIVLKSGSLNLLEPSWPVEACSGIALPFTKRKHAVPRHVVELYNKKTGKCRYSNIHIHSADLEDGSHSRQIAPLEEQCHNSKNAHFELCPQEVCLRPYLLSGKASHVYFLKWFREGRSVVLLMLLHRPVQWFFLSSEKLYFSGCDGVLLEVRYVHFPSATALSGPGPPHRAFTITISLSLSHSLTHTRARARCQLLWTSI
jgi:hypothetical protein